MAVIILPKPLKNKYEDLKSYALKKSLNTQFVIDSTLSKNSRRAITANILVQMASKVGNALWVPETS